MDAEPNETSCCECRHFMLLCGVGPWCYKYHVRTTANGHCDYAERMETCLEEKARFIDGYTEQAKEIQP